MMSTEGYRWSVAGKRTMCSWGTDTEGVFRADQHPHFTSVRVAAGEGERLH